VRRIKADRGQVEQVIMNLLVNARDAMPLGGKLTVTTSDVMLDEVHASRHVGVKPGAHVLLTVSDTGTGMDRATLARIFEPFFTTKELGKGTGLGLATVFGIVRQSGGSICVDSELGTGTNFKIYFPMVEGALSRRRSEAPSLDRISLFGTETVLLVEDDERVRALVRAILLKFGYVVLDAQSAGDAFLLAEQHVGVIELLLTDVVMPRMSGRQLADRLLTERPEMKVLYMSGYTNDAVVRHGVSNSTIAFIQKPITPEPLMRKIREVLDAESIPNASGFMAIALPVSVSS
jgi:two-component system cell cycle sensor histidine kinase/response regulator CckA